MNTMSSAGQSQRQIGPDIGLRIIILLMDGGYSTIMMTRCALKVTGMSMTLWETRLLSRKKGEGSGKRAGGMCMGMMP